MFPYVHHHERCPAVSYRITGIGFIHDIERTRRVLHQPCPTRPEQSGSLLLEFGLEIIERTVFLLQRIQQLSLRFLLRLRREGIEVKGVVPHLRAVVENRPLSPTNNLLQRYILILRTGDELVEVIHVSLQMLSVMVFYRLPADMGLQRIFRVGQFRHFMCHNVIDIKCNMFFSVYVRYGKIHTIRNGFPAGRPESQRKSNHLPINNFNDRIKSAYTIVSCPKFARKDRFFRRRCYIRPRPTSLI